MNIKKRNYEKRNPFHYWELSVIEWVDTHFKIDLSKFKCVQKHLAGNILKKTKR